ncbi:hypothetical protein ACKI1J_32360 [Streptomyces scabiei]|uniref:Uncharacterized protein n=1 Tax=Streptomyces brasiliscabiei TaxID=2736302 RepID=A0ABU8GPY5_9ACTN
MFHALIVRAADVLPGDTVRGYYAPGVTLEAAELPGRPWTAGEDPTARPGLLARPYRAATSGTAAVVVSRALASDEPVLITRTP